MKKVIIILAIILQSSFLFSQHIRIDQIKGLKDSLDLAYQRVKTLENILGQAGLDSTLVGNIVKDSIIARGLISAEEVANMIKDSVASYGYKNATEIANMIKDSLNARGYPSLLTVQQVAKDSADRAETNAKAYTDQQFNANPKGWQTKPNVISQIDSSLNANPKGWRNSQQAKQDAMDTASVSLSSLSQQITDLNNSVSITLQQLSSRIDTIENRLNIPTIPNVYPPTNVIATNGNKQISLTWTQPSTPYDSLQIYWSYSLGAEFNYLTKLDSPATSYTHTNLLNNTRYYYYLISYKGSYYSSPSIIVNAKTDSVIRENFAIMADFEDNNLSQLSSTVVDTATSLVVVRDSAKINGNYGLLIQDNGYQADNAYGRINYSSKDSLYLRFYIKIPSTFKSINTPNSFSIGGIFSGNTNLAGIFLARTTNVFTHKLTVYNGDSYIDVLSTINKNTVYCFELFYKKGTGTNAVVRLYINGELSYSFTTGTKTSSSDNARVGIFSFGSRIDVGSYFFIDDIVVNNSFIGLFGGSSSSGGGGIATSGKLYVAPNNLGNATGADSSNAVSFSALDFSNIPSTTDTVILTAGIYNLTTTKNLTLQRPSDKPLTIMSSYPYGATLTSNTTIFSITGSYLRFKFLKFQNNVRAYSIGANANVIYIDSCYATKFSGQGGFVMASGTSGGYTSIDSIFIRYNYAMNDTQTYTQADIIYAQYMQNLFVVGNTLTNKDTVDVSQHIDCIQTANNMGTVVIVGNKIENYKKESSQGMMLNIPQAGEQIIYNNVVYVPSNAKAISSYWVTNVSNTKIYYLHNTTYNKSAVSGWVGITFEMYGRQGVVSYNNIAYNDGTPNTSNIFSAVYYDYAVFWGDSIDNNLYWTNYCPSPSGSPGAGNYYSISAYNVNTGVSSVWSLSQWQSSTNNPDRNSLQVNPSFKDKSTGDLRLATGSPALGSGKNISSLISYFNSKYPNCGFEWKDVNGVPRGSSPNIGAYEGAY